MERTIETTAELLDCDLAVRLCDGDQVLAERKLIATRDNDWRDWCTARRYMQRHDILLGDPALEATAKDSFRVAICALFPEFGTVPDGVKL
jgi:hypothetical protein